MGTNLLGALLPGLSQAVKNLDMKITERKFIM